MSVADMMAAARGEKAGGGKPAAAAASAQSESTAQGGTDAGAKSGAKEKAAAAKGGDKAAAAKPAKGPAAPASATPTKSPAALDTASILSAVRSGAKPGPVSKSEVPTRAKPAEEKSKKIAVPPMPDKPAYAVVRPTGNVVATETRRSFFASVNAKIVGSSLALGFASLAVTHVLWALGLARFMFPNILTEPPTRFKVGFPDVLGLGQVDERFKAQFGVWIVKAEYEGQPQIFAIKSVCTHLGCTPNWLEAEQKFKCPCHGSGFYKDGVNFEGPAPRPLERYAIRVSDDGQLEVDKSRVFHEELGQWKDGSSFVPV
jgi:cytochrome b6-f complex iron-sulfur subunit